VRVVGPRLDDPAWVGDWTPPAGDDPLVLVGMSSTFMDHADVLQRAATALGDLPVRGLVTTGPAVPAGSIDAPANVTVVERAPHSEVLRHASAVVTHAGHGTVIKSLAAGVPVVAVPLGRDQLDNAARVAHHGAGLRLKPRASSEAIATAVKRVLDEPSFRASAERLAAAIAAETAEDRAADEFEKLAECDESVKGSDPSVAPSAAL
jgi:MGT family glycosyltransferase